MSLLLTLNIFHILHGVKYAKIQILYWNKKFILEVISLIDCKSKGFSSQIHPTPPHRPTPTHPEHKPIKFVLCPYIRPGRINGILRYNHWNHLKSLHPLHIINHFYHQDFPNIKGEPTKNFCWSYLADFSHWGGRGFEGIHWKRKICDKSLFSNKTTRNKGNGGCIS